MKYLSTLVSFQAVTTRFALLPLIACWTLVCPALASEQPSGPATGEEALAPEIVPIAPVFPDPALMKRARTYRSVGVTLSIVGAVAFVASFNVTLAAMRSGDEDFIAAAPVWTIPSLALTFVALEVGAPLWAVGGEMYRQLTRNTRGDEKLRRSVANDPRYWEGRVLASFGTAMALTGGIQLMVGTLLLVGAIWVVERVELIEEESGQAVNRNIVMAPVALLMGSTGMLIGGLEMRRKGMERAQSVRDAHATTAVMVVPYVNRHGGGLALAGRF